MVNGKAVICAYCMHTVWAKHLLVPLRPRHACRRILCLPIIRKFQNNIFAFAPFCNAPWPCKPVQAVWVWGGGEENNECVFRIKAALKK